MRIRQVIIVMFRLRLNKPVQMAVGIGAAIAAATLVASATHGTLSATRAAARRSAGTGSITIATIVGHSCPATVTLPAWTHNAGVSTIRMINGGMGYVGHGLSQEGVFNPQAGWTLMMGGLAVSDLGQEGPVLAGWTPLPGTGRVRLTPGSSHWTLDAAWRMSSRCLSVETAIPSLSFASPILHVAKTPKLTSGSRVACRFKVTGTGNVHGGCAIVPS